MNDRIKDLEEIIIKVINGNKFTDVLVALGFTVNKLIRENSSKDNWDYNIENFCRALKKSIPAADLEENPTIH